LCFTKEKENTIKGGGELCVTEGGEERTKRAGDKIGKEERKIENERDKIGNVEKIGGARTFGRLGVFAFHPARGVRQKIVVSNIK
jgi:hypothetical protein